MRQTDINRLGLGANHTAAQQWLAQFTPYLNYLQSVHFDTSIQPWQTGNLEAACRGRNCWSWRGNCGRP